MTEICAGLAVVEMGSGSEAAAIAGMVLADAGARVIKIEAPGGDALRVRNPSGFLVWKLSPAKAPDRAAVPSS